MSLAQQERAKYEKVWAECELYHRSSPGLRHAPEAYGWYLTNQCETLFDFGCGDGRALRWFEAQPEVKRVWGCDIAHYRTECLQVPLWEPIPEAYWCDFGFSCDVLEHIPPEKVDDCLEVMAQATKKAAWIQVAMFEDTAGSMGDWGPLHLTIEQLPWWRHAISRHFNVVHATERHRRATFLCLK